MTALAKKEIVLSVSPDIAELFESGLSNWCEAFALIENPDYN